MYTMHDSVCLINGNLTVYYTLYLHCTCSSLSITNYDFMSVLSTLYCMLSNYTVHLTTIISIILIITYILHTMNIHYTMNYTVYTMNYLLSTNVYELTMMCAITLFNLMLSSVMFITINY